MTAIQRGYSRRKALLGVAGAVLVALGVSVGTDVRASASKRTVITISRAMALPGVTLQPGSYTFEVLNPSSTADVVAVRGNGNRKNVQFVRLTRRVDRPRSLPANQPLSFGEAA